MTCKEAITLASAVRPHAIEDKLMLHFLSELEGRIAVEIRHEMPGEASAVRGMGQKLSVPTPFDRVYWTYLVAMIDLSVADASAYKTSMSLFKEAYRAYAAYYQRTGGAG